MVHKFFMRRFLLGRFKPLNAWLSLIQGSGRIFDVSITQAL
jgi:hypothetical protein